MRLCAASFPWTPPHARLLASPPGGAWKGPWRRLTCLGAAVPRCWWGRVGVAASCAPAPLGLPLPASRAHQHQSFVILRCWSLQMYAWNQRNPEGRSLVYLMENGKLRNRHPPHNPSRWAESI